MKISVHQYEKYIEPKKVRKTKLKKLGGKYEKFTRSTKSSRQS